MAEYNDDSGRRVPEGRCIRFVANMLAKEMVKHKKGKESDLMFPAYLLGFSIETYPGLGEIVVCENPKAVRRVQDAIRGHGIELETDRTFGKDKIWIRRIRGICYDCGERTENLRVICEACHAK